MASNIRIHIKKGTGKDDNGITALRSGERVPKSHERIDAIGDIDELTSSLGILRVHLPRADEEIGKEIRRIQSDLFHVGNPPKVLRWVVVHLNRLSDYVLLVGRYCNHLAGIADDPWEM